MLQGHHGPQQPAGTLPARGRAVQPALCADPRQDRQGSDPGDRFCLHDRRGARR